MQQGGEHHGPWSDRLQLLEPGCTIEGRLPLVPRVETSYQRTNLASNITVQPKDVRGHQHSLATVHAAAGCDPNEANDEGVQSATQQHIDGTCKLSRPQHVVTQCSVLPL